MASRLFKKQKFVQAAVVCEITRCTDDLSDDLKSWVRKWPVAANVGLGVLQRLSWHTYVSDVIEASFAFLWFLGWSGLSDSSRCVAHRILDQQQGFPHKAPSRLKALEAFVNSVSASRHNALWAGRAANGMGGGDENREASKRLQTM